ncbi:MAG: ABC transporter ATP-binding protein/permease [Alphaproteobacteria bacterium]|jgi:subfamily B ATP-binding cassette protein MsbA|nr:ABC transporter ATP-binding protein/permease [Alphaproteobacteria bacterium]
MIKKLLFKVLKTDSEKEVNSTKVALKRFLKDIMLPNLPTIVVSIIFMAIFAGANAGLAWIIKPIINNVFISREANTIMYIGLGVIGITLVKSLSQYIYTILLFSVSVKVMAKARRSLYHVFMEQDIYFHHKNSPGKLVSVTMNELNAMNNLATEIPINVGRDLFTFLGLLGLMFYQNYIYASLIVASIFIIVIPVRMIGKKVKSAFAKNNKGLGELTAQLEQTLNGIKEVKSYNKEKREEARTDDIINSLAKVQVKINRVNSILPPLMEIFGGVSIGIVLIYAGYQVVHHGADAGVFFSFVAALLIAYQPLKRLSEFTVKIQMGALAIKRYYSFLDSKPSIKEVENPLELVVNKGEIEFQNVEFSYNPSTGDVEKDSSKSLVQKDKDSKAVEKKAVKSSAKTEVKPKEKESINLNISADKIADVKKSEVDTKKITTPSKENPAKIPKAIDDMSFKILPAQKVALVGRSGGGKSTIINLIERFYDVDKGKILIDDQNIKEVSIKSLRKNISLVSQEVILFDDTIYNNIAYSKEEATHEEIIEVAKSASCLDFINKLPQGFDTMIGPRGAKLSGGQRQRISIARALLKDSPILLLDEATSALDTESEKAIQKALDVLMQNKTTIIIAHRLSTIINCDKIFVIDSGKILEQGNHKELIKNPDSFYKYLYDLQFKQQEETL